MDHPVDCRNCIHFEECEEKKKELKIKTFIWGLCYCDNYHAKSEEKD